MNLPDANALLDSRCRELGLPPQDPEDARTLFDVALHDMSVAAQKTAHRAHFHKSFTAAITSGLVSLLAQTDMLIDFMENVVHSDGTIVSLLPMGASGTDILFERNLLFYHGVRRASRLEIRQGDGTNAPDGTVTWDAGFTPTLQSLPAIFNEDLIERVVRLIPSVSKNEQATA